MSPEQLAKFITEDIHNNNGLVLEHNLQSLVNAINIRKQEGDWYLQDLFPEEVIDIINNQNFIKLHHKVIEKYKTLGIFPERPYKNDSSLARLVGIVGEITKEFRIRPVATPSGPGRIGGKWTDKPFVGPKI